MKRLITSLALVGVCTGSLFAINGSITGASVAISYQEPNLTEAEDITNTTYPLDDLSFTTVYYQVAGSTFAVVGATITATAASGNGIINTTVVVPTRAKRKTTYVFWATATDTSGNESVPSPTFNVIVDKLSPGAPR